MNGQLNSLESFDSGSNYRFGDKMIKTSSPRSLFDLSHLNSLTIPNCGLLVPIALWETLPSDDFDISVDSLLRVMPQVVPLYSRQRLYVYGFYSRYSDLWNNWQVFMDKGYTGTVSKTIPILHHSQNKSNVAYSSNNSKLIQPDSLGDYLGLPIGASADDLFDYTSVHTGAGISALPFMMYLRIYRDYFMNKNHWINDRVMLPDDDSRFRLDDDGLLLSAKDQSKSFVFNFRHDSEFDLVIDSNGVYKFGGALHDYPDDYFTSALPFPQRGTASELTYNVSMADLANKLKLQYNGPEQEASWTSSADSVGLYAYSSHSHFASGSISSNTLTVNTAGIDKFKDALTDVQIAATSQSGQIGLQITYNDIIKLALEQQELIQLARTDGSYHQFGLSFFGEPSRASYDYRPTYIGGTYKNIAFTEVLQHSTTQTTDPDSNVITNPTGAMFGHGITGITNGRIGHIHCDDYGMIMILACVMPDVYYSQGLEKIFTDSVQSEKFLPERVLLGMQPILNKEIYYAGNNGISLGDDNYLWGYQNPFDHLRYIPNHIHGKIADTSNESFYPFTQARHFTQLPNWGRAFSSTKDVRKDYLTAPSEDAYSAQFSINVRAVRPLPYKAIPAKLVHF